MKYAVRNVENYLDISVAKARYSVRVAGRITKYILTQLKKL
jgi:hypothetical protein